MAVAHAAPQNAAPERTPLLKSRCQDPEGGYTTFPKGPEPEEEDWKRPKGFWIIQIALWSNVFLSGFDSTVTASTYALIGSEFHAANHASWLTTSYLITSTAFQPLYGRFSDLLGRRACFFLSTITFTAGCLGCSVADSMLALNAMRALTGFGGGGLITMATIVNSDLIPFRKRGMYQAIQNILVGLGAVSGASLGGVIAVEMGWRWCFALQVPVSLLAFAVGYAVLRDPPPPVERMAQPTKGIRRLRSVLARLDVSGSLVLVLALSAQLAGLSLGGNEFAWSSAPVIASLVVSFVLLAVFLVIEANTRAFPIIPLEMLKGYKPVMVQLTNIFAGMAAYAYLFMVPLFFQAVRGDSASTAGFRLVVPSMATPVGGVIAGVLMQRGCKMSYNVRLGTAMMFIGNLLAIGLGRKGSSWSDVVFLLPANLGLGLTNPSVLFSFVSLFEHQEQAVATSTVYLIRSMGTIYGVTMTSAVVQNVLVNKLPGALGNVENKDEIIETIRQSVFAINDLSPALQAVVRAVYFDALKLAFVVATAVALLSFFFSWTVRVDSLGRKGSQRR
ncbi:major facilitator superfamily domain-containing protein [Plectosphaerella cucumerina]|uniref:Major facilitator superfamily domain-containing protein n=1 Tax=Plectosphaerella cucumerina TaxID=40658 RepID=A0A8K0TKQ5_9PEZI|nr:major facilitator superfamily domain-containing protein [Plectosphaerella cucumerina]